jgi:hypothetical protein
MSEIACIFYDYVWLLVFIAIIGVCIWLPFALAHGIRREE